MTQSPDSSSALAEAREWLARADEDLSAADVLLRSTPPHLGTAAYHAQQAAEKGLKAFLVGNNAVFRLTHNLEDLLPSCETLDPGFGQFRPAARTLTPYGTRFRYPGGPLHPTAGEAEQALQLAGALVVFVRQRLGI